MACASGAHGRRLVPVLLLVRLVVVIVEQDAFRRALEVVILAAPQRPEKPGEPEKTEDKGGGDEKDEDIHLLPFVLPRFSRSEFSVTVIEELDIATAATSGVTKPATASGTATAL